MSPMDTPLDHNQEEAVSLVEWAFTPIGHSKPKELQASGIASTIQRDSLCFMTDSPSEAHKQLL